MRPDGFVCFVAYGDFVRGSDRSASFLGALDSGASGESSPRVASRFDAAGFARTMQPRRPVVREKTVLDETTPVKTPKWGPGGPLAEEWEFASFVGTHDGRISMVQLRRVRRARVC